MDVNFYNSEAYLIFVIFYIPAISGQGILHFKVSRFVTIGNHAEKDEAHNDKHERHNDKHERHKERVCKLSDSNSKTHRCQRQQMP